MAPKKVKPGATTRSNSQNRNIPHTPLNQTTDSETDDDELKLEGIDIETASTQDMLKFLCRQSVQIKQMQREIVSLKDQLRRKDDKVISLEHRHPWQSDFALLHKSKPTTVGNHSITY